MTEILLTGMCKASTCTNFTELKNFNPYKPSVFFGGTYTNSADPDQTPQNAVSDQGLHCLFKECSIRI